MPRGRRKAEDIDDSDIRPSATPQGRENQMIEYAVSLAEKQLREGTASSQVITHYLKLATEKERLEREILRKNAELIRAKTEALQAQKTNEEMYKKAIRAMGLYSGVLDEDDEDSDIF